MQCMRKVSKKGEEDGNGRNEANRCDSPRCAPRSPNFSPTLLLPPYTFQITMARGNQRDKSREKNLQKAAQVVRCHLLQSPVAYANPSAEEQDHHDGYPIPKVQGRRCRNYA